MPVSGQFTQQAKPGATTRRYLWHGFTMGRLPQLGELGDRRQQPEADLFVDETVKPGAVSGPTRGRAAVLKVFGKRHGAPLQARRPVRYASRAAPNA